MVPRRFGVLILATMLFCASAAAAVRAVSTRGQLMPFDIPGGAPQEMHDTDVPPMVPPEDIPAEDAGYPLTTMPRPWQPPEPYGSSDSGHREDVLGAMTELFSHLPPGAWNGTLTSDWASGEHNEQPVQCSTSTSEDATHMNCTGLDGTSLPSLIQFEPQPNVLTLNGLPYNLDTHPFTEFSASVGRIHAAFTLHNVPASVDIEHDSTRATIAIVMQDVTYIATLEHSGHGDDESQTPKECDPPQPQQFRDGEWECTFTGSFDGCAMDVQGVISLAKEPPFATVKLPDEEEPLTFHIISMTPLPPNGMRYEGQTADRSRTFRASVQQTDSIEFTDHEEITTQVRTIDGVVDGGHGTIQGECRFQSRRASYVNPDCTPAVSSLQSLCGRSMAYRTVECKGRVPAMSSQEYKTYVDEGHAEAQTRAMQELRKHGEFTAAYSPQDCSLAWEDPDVWNAYLRVNALCGGTLTRVCAPCPGLGTACFIGYPGQPTIYSLTGNWTTDRSMLMHALGHAEDFCSGTLVNGCSTQTFAHTTQCESEISDMVELRGQLLAAGDTDAIRNLDPYLCPLP